MSNANDVLTPKKKGKPNRPLTARERKFFNALTGGKNLTEAAREAGFAETKGMLVKEQELPNPGIKLVINGDHRPKRPPINVTPSQVPGLGDHLLARVRVV